MDKYDGAVLYTDGSARPNPGFNGWGCHGYLYNLSDKPISNGNNNNVPTDKGYILKKEKGEDTQFVDVQHYLDWFGSDTTPRTNNVSELFGFIEPINNIISKYKVDNITILTDSEYLKKGIEGWLPKWVESNWTKTDGQPVANKDVWLLVKATLDLVKEEGIELEIIKVAAHCNILGNEMADHLALIGTLHSANGIKTSDFTLYSPKGYWKSTVEKHPFISFRRLYLNTTPELNKPGHYFIAEHVGDSEENKKNMIGKKSSSASYAVLDFKEPDPIIEVVKNNIYNLMNGINLVAVCRLDRVYNKDIYKMLSKYKDIVLTGETNKSISVNYLDGKPIASVLIPSCLVLKAIDYSSLLEDILHSYKEGIIDKSDYTLHDISSEFYTRDDKGKVLLNKNIDPQNKLHKVSITIDDTKVEVPIYIGLDLPDRNALKKLEGKYPKVYLVTHKCSESHVKYNVLINADGDIGVWANFFAGDVYIK